MLTLGEPGLFIPSDVMIKNILKKLELVKDVVVFLWPMHCAKISLWLEGFDLMILQLSFTLLI